MMRSRRGLFGIHVVQIGAVLLMLIGAALPASGFDLIGIDHETGNIYEFSTQDASATLMGTTGVPGFGSLELGPDGLLYGSTVGVGASLYTIDPSDFSVTALGPPGDGLFLFEGALAFSPSGVLYGANLDEDSNAQLFTFDRLTGQASIIGTMNGVRDINGLSWRPDGMLVGLDRIDNALLAIDPSDASTTLIALVESTVGSVGGMTVRGNTGYFTTAGPGAVEPGSNELYAFDLFTGGQTLVGPLSPTITGVGISGLAVPEPGTLALLILGGLTMVWRRRSEAMTTA